MKSTTTLTKSYTQLFCHKIVCGNWRQQQKLIIIVRSICQNMPKKPSWKLCRAPKKKNWQNKFVACENDSIVQLMFRWTDYYYCHLFSAAQIYDEDLEFFTRYERHTRVYCVLLFCRSLAPDLSARKYIIFHTRTSHMQRPTGKKKNRLSICTMFDAHHHQLQCHSFSVVYSVWACILWSRFYEIQFFLIRLLNVACTIQPSGILGCHQHQIHI